MKRKFNNKNLEKWIVSNEEKPNWINWKRRRASYNNLKNKVINSLEK